MANLGATNLSRRNFQETHNTSQEVKEETSKEVSKPAKKLRSKEATEEASIRIDFESNKEIEKLVKYGTYLKPSLVKKIKVYAAISEKDQQTFIGEILEKELNKLFKQDGLVT